MTTLNQVLEFLEKNIADLKLKEQVTQALKPKEKQVSAPGLEPAEELLLDLAKGSVALINLTTMITQLQVLSMGGNFATPVLKLNLASQEVTVELNELGKHRAKLLAERVAKFEKEGVFCSVCEKNIPFKDAFFCEDPYEVEVNKNKNAPKEWFCYPCYNDREESI